MSTTWCVIPARGGSKALPRKNVAPLAGQPLIAYTIAASVAARRITRTIVTTDDPEIAGVAKQSGAEAPFLRPAELARDDSPTLPAVVHAVHAMEALTGERPKLVVLVQPTSPFTRPDQIDAGVDLLLAHPEADAVTTVVEVDHVNHPYNVRRIVDGMVDFMMPEEHHKYLTRQSKPPFYRFGNLYIVRRETLLERQSLFGERCLPLLVDLASCFDINDASDLRLAECMVSAGLVHPEAWLGGPWGARHAM